MNLLYIIDKNLSSEEEYILDEGIFEVTPAIAMFAFKDSVARKLSAAKEKISHPVANITGHIAVAKEKAKAKTTGRSGNKDDDNVYTLTKEQKKAMAYIYKKYGPQLVNDIEKFRNDVMLSYSIIKRNVARNHSLNNKEIFGMTKEEYYKYRESGRKKIEKKGTYFKDYDDLSSKQREAREALEDTQKKYDDFKDGKIIDLTSTNIEKVLDEAGLGRKELKGWADSELEKTATKINEVMDWLQDPKRANGENIRVQGRSGAYKAKYQSREQLENYLNDLREHGIFHANGERAEDNNHHGSFKAAFANYLLRREKIREIKSNSTNADFKRFYEKVLKDAIDSAKKIYDEKFNNYLSLKGTVELNQYEKKIWGRKITGVEYSGKIDDWYLKIKPEDFIETKYYQKSDKIIKAEKEFDKALKTLERKLKKVMSPEDVEYCRKLKLFNSFLTVKELRDSKNMFNTEKPVASKNKEDLSEMIKSALSKEYNSMKDLETEQSKVKSAIEGSRLSGEEEKLYKEFMKRMDPKRGSTATKTDRTKLTSVINKINNTVYTGKTQAVEDLKELESTISDFKEVNGEEELKPFIYEINKAKGNLNAFINGGKDNASE